MEKITIWIYSNRTVKQVTDLQCVTLIEQSGTDYFENIIIIYNPENFVDVITASYYRKTITELSYLSITTILSPSL